MKYIGLFLLVGAGLFAHALANDDPGPYKKFSGSYRVYGGGLGDPVAPTLADQKVAFSIGGTAAKEIFNAIGPDKEDICSQHSRDRVRHKDDENLECRRSEEGEYSCSFGFDLRTGKSIGGSIC